MYNILLWYYGRSSLLDVNLHNLQWSLCKTTCELRTAHPQFNIVCSWLWELFAEKWWSVERAASTATPTSLTIPEWIICKQSPWN